MAKPEFARKKQVFAAHFDILGMSELIKRSDDQAWLVLLDFAEVQGCCDLPLTKESRETLSELFFSDTLIIYSQDDTIGSLHTILARSLEVFRYAVGIGVPLRGGIAFGD